MSTNLIARVLPYLPGTLVEGSAIDIVQAGTTYTISWDSTEAGFSTFGLTLGGAANAAAAQALLAPLPLSWRNILANGGLEVWQRGAGNSASFALAASAGNPYTADRWYVGNGANQAMTIAAVAGIVNGSRLAAKIQRNNAQTGVGTISFSCPLDTDECFMLQGQVATLSFTAKAGANYSSGGGLLNAVLVVGTGAAAKSAGFTGTTQQINANAILTTTPTRFTFISTTIPTTTTQAEIQLQFVPIGTAGADDSFTIDDVQLEVGTLASTFERRPFESSLMACRRHFLKTFSYGTAPVQNAGVNTGEIQFPALKAGATAGNFFAWRYPVQMRVAPAITAFNPSAANSNARDETAAADCTAAAALNATAETVTLSYTGAAGTGIGNVLGVHLTADAGI